MESAGLRKRAKRASTSKDLPMQELDTYLDDDELFEPPRYTINLSLPPDQRYRHLAADFVSEAATLPILFDEIVGEMVPNIFVHIILWFARLIIRRLYYKEETEELRGTSEAIGIEMWLLVSFDVLLDLLMGCTLGAVKVDDLHGGTTMLHFRALDWGMDRLRKVIVQMDFVEKPGGDVVASSITYVGYVGVLTGARKGLSMSLNFRPNHEAKKRFANFRFYLHHVLVLLGRRPSISSLLRRHLLPSRTSTRISDVVAPTLDSIERKLPSVTTTAAYLIFSDGDRCLMMEKDHHTAIIRASTDFIAATNHDATEEGSPDSISANSHGSLPFQLAGMDDMTEDSLYRKNLATDLWKASSRRPKRSGSRRSTRQPQLPTEEKVMKWMSTFPIANEMTHFATIRKPLF